MCTLPGGIGKITEFGVKSVYFLKSTKFGGKLGKSEALRSLTLSAPTPASVHFTLKPLPADLRSPARIPQPSNSGSLQHGTPKKVDIWGNADIQGPVGDLEFCDKKGLVVVQSLTKASLHYR
jgi:hypothetical protein